MGGKNEKNRRATYVKISHKGRTGIGLDRVRTVKDVKDAAVDAAARADLKDANVKPGRVNIKEILSDPDKRQALLVGAVEFILKAEVGATDEDAHQRAVTAVEKTR